nr:CopG family transcriptional regulator [uncultured Cellulosilyticum sp.]
MKKSVYSLVLMDEVVDAIDKLAYSMGTSRSQLINEILAEKVAMRTPQQRLQQLFEEISTYLMPHEQFQIQNQAAEHMYSIKSALRYKYNPTIRYSFYINQQQGKLIGQLRIVSRTQSPVLSGYLKTFFNFWAALENGTHPVSWSQEEGVKWLRTLNLESFMTPQNYPYLAGYLSDYIKLLDQGLRIFFTQIEKGIESPEEIVNLYESYCKSLKILI